jgi:hypothetical protein
MFPPPSFLVFKFPEVFPALALPEKAVLFHAFLVECRCGVVTVAVFLVVVEAVITACEYHSISSNHASARIQAAERSHNAMIVLNIVMA